MFNSPRDRFILIAVGSYLILALLWIFLSDHLLMLVSGPDAAMALSTVKGIFFVIATAALFFFALRAIPASTAERHGSSLDALAEGIGLGGQPRWLIYGFAITIALSVLALRMAIPLDLGRQPLMILFMLPIILSALMGGLGPGLLATALLGVGIDLLAKPALHAYASPSYVHLQWILLMVNGIAVSILSALLRRSIASLEVNQRLMDSIVSGTSDAVFVKDRQGRYQMVNAAAAAFVGKSPAQLLGLDDSALFDAASAKSLHDTDAAILAAGKVQTHIEQLTIQGGENLVFMVTKGPVFDKRGSVIGLFGISRDITRQQLDQDALKASEAALRHAQRLAKVGNWEWDLQTGRPVWSEEIYRILGRDPQRPPADYAEMQGYFTSESWQRLAPLVMHCQETGQAYQCDAEIIRDDGEHRWITSRGEAFTDPQGRITRMYGTMQDITEAKLLALQLQASQERLQLVVEATSDGFWDWDISRQYIYRSPRYYEVTGYSASEDSHDFAFFSQMIHPEDRASVLSHINAHRRGETGSLDFTFRLVTKSGSIRWMRVLGRAVHRDASGEATRLIGSLSDISEHKHAEEALQEREQQLARVIEGSDQGYWEWNLQTNEFVVSSRWQTMLGYEPGELDVQPDNWPSIVQSDDLAVAKDSIERHLRGEIPSHEVELRCRTKAGGWRWILSCGRIVTWDEQGRPLLMSGTHTDITERKILEQAQKEAAVVFESSYEGIMVVSPENLITKVNAAFTRITGYSAEEAIGQSPRLLASGQHDDLFYQAMWHSVHEHDFWRGEIWNKRKNGEVYAELLSISTVRNAQGELLHYVGLFSDISQLKAHEFELDRVAHYDPLTGVPNRRLLSDRLQQAIARSVRHHHSCAICFLDLDNFKAVNDRYGHEVGDQLLIGVTHHLQSVLRNEDTISRIGGDEFVILLADIHSAEECTLILDRLMAAIGESVSASGIQISISASIGVTLYPEDDEDPDTLLRHADQAMYQAKEAGKNRYQLFDPESDRKAQTHRKYLETMHQSLLNQEFVLFYQPKVDLDDGRVIGVEALIRWQHPTQGLLAPADFLPHLHGSHLETTFGEWVIQTAMAQAAAWHQMGLLLTVSVNVSANHLLQPGFLAHLQAALARHPGLDPEHFELEVLESAAIADMEQAIGILLDCRQLGIHFALDDFGTGYSSLTYLRKLPIDTLKIDQSFVRDMLTDNDDLGIVEGVIQLANVFHRQVIAEGVETMEHGRQLRLLGCHLAQGFGIARPMPAQAVVPWCQQWQHDQRWRSV